MCTSPSTPSRHLHKRAKLHHPRHRALDRRAHRKLLRRIRPRIAQRLLQPQRHPLLRRTHRQDHRLHCVALLQHVAGLLHLLHPRHLRHMDQPLDPRLQFHKRAKIHQPRHRAGDPLARLVLVPSPSSHGSGLQLLQPQRNPPRLRIDLQHLHLNLLPHRQHIFRASSRDSRQCRSRAAAHRCRPDPQTRRSSPGCAPCRSPCRLPAARQTGVPCSRQRLLLGTARRSTTTSSSATSSLVIRQVISCPTSFSISRASRVPLREAGINARTPTSTLRPPFTTAVTVPTIADFCANASSSDAQSVGCATRASDST